MRRQRGLIHTNTVNSYYHVTFHSETTLWAKYAHFDGKW